MDIYGSYSYITQLDYSFNEKPLAQVASLFKVPINHSNFMSGGYNEYLRKQNEESQSFNQKDRRLIIENKISEVLGKISMPSKKDNVELLDLKYKDLIKELKDIKNLH
ncbi:hypothetical protein KPL47_07260 [Clostridium estertheticum]|uniref:hypothetical protein n=1 Tax=Clostridium estertheticum TaxID=238834 RepID=UPI001C0D076E|nr:hypothetical protein [Clostridium estertheticum]MBU3176166.1 hypothetical protein [Clostridium estertheticum]